MGDGSQTPRSGWEDLKAAPGGPKRRRLATGLYEKPSPIAGRETRINAGVVRGDF
jgi:hypothetical protein